MHQPGSGDYASQYYPHHYPNPNPNPADFPQSNPNQPPFASAPLYSQFPSSDPANYSSGYSNFPQNPDPIPGFQNPQFPHLQSFNNPPQPLNFPQEFNPVGYSYYPGSELPQPALNYAPNPPSSGLYEDPYGSFGNEGLGDGVYAYDGGKVEPYGARGMGSFGGGGNSGFGGGGSLEESDVKFDDYGRSLGPASGSVKDNGCKIVRAVPKMESQQDVKNGVQKFRVKLLPEGASVTTMDVLCQIGLDGIRMLDPSTNRTLRIYPLENVTRWDVLDSSIFTFWSKSPVDIEPRRIRLQSNSYTTNTILDIVTAATVQLKEMGGKEILGKGIGDAGNSSDQQTEKKKGFADWMNLMKPGNEEKDHWVPDEAVSKCTSCGTDFGAFVRRHHCRNCGDIFCDKCTQGRIALTADEQAQPVRVCDRCMAEVSQRLSNAKDIANKSTGIHSHEDLARKLQEEMERNRKSFSGSKSSSDGSGKRMREVACPICTVHLQVQVPSSGSETIECGVCQHPFLVSAH